MNIRPYIWCSKARRVVPLEELYPAVYVYLWFDADSELPYYVGIGSGARAWAEHGSMRAPSRVVVFAAGLSRAAASVVEMELIHHYTGLGAVLQNIRIIQR